MENEGKGNQKSTRNDVEHGSPMPVVTVKKGENSRPKGNKVRGEVYKPVRRRRIKI